MEHQCHELIPVTRQGEPAGMQWAFNAPSQSTTTWCAAPRRPRKVVRLLRSQTIPEPRKKGHPDPNSEQLENIARTPVPSAGQTCFLRKRRAFKARRKNLITFDEERITVRKHRPLGTVKPDIMDSRDTRVIRY